MQQVITINEAQVKQVTVEIKVMKIGNKQVTQSVFRQLEKESIINNLTGEIKGIPWGRVNYHVECIRELSHIHVVWQKDDCLMRAIAEPFVNSAFRARWLRDLHLAEDAFIARTLLDGYSPNIPIPEHYFNIGNNVIPHYRFKSHSITYNYKKEDLLNLFLSYLQGCELPDDTTHYTLETTILDLVSSIDVTQKKWDESYTLLKQLDQLFIAV